MLLQCVKLGSNFRLDELNRQCARKNILGRLALHRLKGRNSTVYVHLQCHMIRKTGAKLAGDIAENREAICHQPLGFRLFLHLLKRAVKLTCKLTSNRLVTRREPL